MHSFLQCHDAEIKGVLSGFDRIRFRGTLRWLASVRGMFGFLQAVSVLLKDFRAWMSERTERIRAASQQVAQEAGRPVIYLHSSRASKEQLAVDIAERDAISEGLVCVLTCVEPCKSFRVAKNADTKRLELRYESMKCLHYYFYVLDRRLGLLHVRLQTWAPFTVHVCVNGREWLARQLMSKGIEFEQRDNCFVDVADVTRAQALLDRQLRTDWTALLDRLLSQVHPTHRGLFGKRQLEYYWSADETEWATDVMFRSRDALARIYPRLTRHALTTFGSKDVLRFLGQAPRIRRNSRTEITTSLQTRPEGMRIKHTRSRNSLKMYDKQETVLRVETTINDPRELKVLRAKEGEPESRKSYRRLRKGVADLQRRAEVSQKSNERYLEAMATVDAAASLGEAVRPLCQPVRWNGRRVRGLQPHSATDSQLLAAVSQGEFVVNGFRNRDLRTLLFGPHKLPPQETKRQAAKVTRLIRLLRAHGVIQKIPKTHRYRMTPRGTSAITALTAAQHASIETLSKLAA
jgi:hypothetical protein